MFDGQFYPYQPIQFMDGLLAPIIGAGVSSAITIRASNANTDTDGNTTIAAALPASIVAGEELLLFVAAEAAAGRTVTTPAGWTLIPNLSYGNSPSTFRRLAGFYRVANGAEGASVTVTFSGNCNAIAAVSLAVSNYQGTPESSVTPSAFNSAAPDPVSLTPSWGATSATLWLSVLGHEQGETINSGPSGYTLQQETSSAALRLAVHYKVSTAASDDPGAYALAAAATGWTATAGIRQV